MTSKDCEGAYVRSIVAKMDDARKERSPTKSPPRRSAPSYLGVSRTNSGYNNSLLYGTDHRMDPTDQNPPAVINGGGKIHKECNNGTVQPPDSESPTFVSLAMLGTKPKTSPSKYTDLGLNLKSPEKNCRSFLKNIHSFERIAKESVLTKNDGETVTLVGKKMQHLLHLDNDQPDATLCHKAQPPVIPSSISLPSKSTVPDVNEDYVEVVSKLLHCVQDHSVFEGLIRSDHDGHFFRKMAAEEKNLLVKLCEVTSRELVRNQQIPDDARGRLMAAQGKAKLLLSEKFVQFDGLCDDNLHQKPGGQEVGPGDLAGFWDLVLIEVNSVKNEFRFVKDWMANKWEQVIEETKAPVKRSKSAGAKRGPPTPTHQKIESSKSEALKKERKDKIAELRKLNKQRMKNDGEVEICMPVNSELN